MKRVVVSLYIPADEYLRHYKGSVRSVLAYDQTGRRIKFPANILQRFVTRDGIRGVFEITFDDNNKFSDIQRLS